LTEIDNKLIRLITCIRSLAVTFVKIKTWPFLEPEKVYNETLSIPIECESYGKCVWGLHVCENYTVLMNDVYKGF